MTTQHWNPDTYARNARFVSDLGAGVFELLAPQPGERVLDLGCGDGALTEKLVAAGCRVIAIDSSAEQIGAARARGLDARRGRAETLPFKGEFDAVFSNAVLHWIPRRGRGDRLGAPRAEAGRPLRRRVRRRRLRADRPPGADRRRQPPRPRRRGARSLVLSDRGRVSRAARGAAASSVRAIALFPRPTPLPGDITDWLETFAQPFLGAVPAGERDAFLQDVRGAVQPALFDPARGWTADYVRLRFDAMKAH